MCTDINKYRQTYSDRQSNRWIVHKDVALSRLLLGGRFGKDTQLTGWSPPQPAVPESSDTGSESSQDSTRSEPEEGDDCSIFSGESSVDKQINGYVLSPSDGRTLSALAFRVGSFLLEVMCLRTQIILRACNGPSNTAAGQRPNG